MAFRKKGKYELLGIADILAVYKGKFIAIEVKTRSGKPTDNQMEFAKNVNANGGIAILVRSMDNMLDAWKKINEQYAREAKGKAV